MCFGKNNVGTYPLPKWISPSSSFFSSTALIGKPVITQFLVERVQIAPLGGKKARLSHEN